MVLDAIQPVSSNTTAFDAAQAASLNNNQITAMLLNKNIDPKFATILLNQMAANSMDSILFGSENEQQNADIFGSQGLTPNNLQGTTTLNNTDIFGATAFGSVSPQYEMSVYSALIGKTVMATDPLNGEQISGKVTSVQYQNGKVMLEVNGKFIPTENMTGIKQGG